MLKTRKRHANWTVQCKVCGRPFPAPFERQSLDELPDMNAYQCPLCGETEQYGKDDHTPAA